MYIRTFTCRDGNTIRMFYSTHVYPILDYCSTIWNSHLLNNIRKLESVQRRVTILIPSLYDLSYTEQLHAETQFLCLL